MGLVGPNEVLLPRMFWPQLTNNLLGELINLNQIGIKYQRQFQTLLTRVTSIGADQQVDMFIARLIYTLRMDVNMQNLPNLVTAINLARGFKRKM